MGGSISQAGGGGGGRRRPSPGSRTWVFDPFSGTRYHCYACNRSFVKPEEEGEGGQEGSGSSSGSTPAGPINCEHCDSEFVEELPRPQLQPPGSIRMSSETLRELLMSDSNMDTAELLMNVAFFGRRSGLEALARLNLGAEGDTEGEPKGTHVSVIQSLPKVTLSEKDIALQNECTVCSEDYAAGDSAIQLPCGHFYHPDCVIPWLEKHTSCPVCRFEMTEENIANSDGKLSRFASSASIRSNEDGEAEEADRSGGDVADRSGDDVADRSGDDVASLENAAE